MGEEFLQTVDRLEEEKSPQYALGFVKGCVESKMEIEALKKRVAELEIEVALYKPVETKEPAITPTAEIQQKYAQHKQHKAEGKQTPRCKGKTAQKIYNQLKLRDNLTVEDLAKLLEMKKNTVYQAAYKMYKKGKIVATKKLGTKVKLYSLPDADKLKVRTVTGVSH